MESHRFTVSRASPRGFGQAFARAGRGVALLLLHGRSETMRVWWRAVEPLASAGFDVIAPDLRGFGSSDAGADGRCDVASHGADLYALVRDHLGIESVVVAGGGLGSAVAQHLSLRFPGFVERMVLFDAPLPIRRENPTRTLLLLGPSEGAGDPDFERRAAAVFPDRDGPIRVEGVAGSIPREAPERLGEAIRSFCTDLLSTAASGDPEGERACIALGSNLGDREVHLARAVAALRGTPGVRVDAVSPVYETEPIGPPPQGPYLNAAARLRTGLSPRALLERLHRIEAGAGRRRGPERDAARTLDLDLLLYGERTIEEPGLEVPHPRLHRRAFALEPLREVAADFLHPVLRLTVAELAARVRDPRAVRRRDC